MNRTSLAEDVLVQEVRIMAPASRIFAALTNPTELLKWWSIPGKFQLIAAEADLRPGGGWKMHVLGGCGPEQTSSTVRGEYRIVEPPRILELTWIRDEEGHPETLVRWELEETDGATLVRVTHSGLSSEALRRRNSGWPMILGLLRQHLERAGKRSTGNEA